MTYKELVVCFSFAVHLEERWERWERYPEITGEITLELKCGNFKFLPPIGATCSFMGFEDTDCKLVVSEYGLLLELGSHFSQEVILRDKRLSKKSIPVISIKELQYALQNGWETN